MNNSITSREAILKTCRKLIAEEGLTALNMRAVSNACGTALGSVYYYFPSKNDLLIATIESVWEDIFCWGDENIKELSFIDYIERCFKQILSGIEKYPNFFTIHSISFSSKGHNKAYAKMDIYMSQIKEKLLGSLKSDSSVKAGAFSVDFSEEGFIEFIISNMVSLLIRKRNDCGVLLEVIRRTIY